jgi:hypothetical protein
LPKRGCGKTGQQEIVFDGAKEQHPTGKQSQNGRQYKEAFAVDEEKGNNYTLTGSF